MAEASRRDRSVLLIIVGACMKRPCFCSCDLTENAQTIPLSDSDAHHAYRVLRLQVGAKVWIVNGNGLRAEGTLQNNNEVILTSVQRCERPFGVLHWVVGLVGLEGLKNIVASATCLGVARFTLVQADFSQVRLSSHTASTWVRKLSTVAIATQKVTGIPFQPEIMVRNWASIIQDSALLWVFHQAAPPISETVLKRIDLKNTLLCFGPEGGFSDREIKLLQNSGAHLVGISNVNIPTTLAPTILTSFVLGGVLRCTT